MGIFIDRLICISSQNRFKSLTLWGLIFILSLLTGLVSFLPSLEWLKYSSRTLHSYIGILTPGITNLLFACFTNTWFRYYPYIDVFYLYIGFIPVWLALVGLLSFNKKEYVYRYFLYTLIFLLYYVLVRLIQISTCSIFDTIDPWRSMLIFCLGVAIISAQGVKNIIEEAVSFKKISAIIIFLLFLFAALCFLKNMEARIYVNLILVAFSIMFISLTKNKGFRKITLLFAVLVNIGVPAFYYAVVRAACTNEVTKERILKSVPFFQYLKNTIKDTHCRVAIFQGSDNLTSLVGLKSVPNYSPFYNKALEQALLSDGLILSNNSQPYWMILNYANAEKLSYYGVKYLIIDSLTVKPKWQEEKFIISPQGWEEIELPPEWSDYYKVLENKYYVGRAYTLSSDGHRRGAKFLVDEPQRVELEVNANKGDILVLADLNYSGWKVYVDDYMRDKKVYRGCLRSVTLKDGIHIVKWIYQDNIRRIGLILSGICVFLLLGLVMLIHFYIF